jgi:hypothetical protein
MNLFLTKLKMIVKQPIKNFISENIFFILSIILVFSLPFSEALLSISTGLIFLQILFTGNWKDKFEKLRNDKALWALISVFLIYLFGCLFCKDPATGFYEIKKNIFWLIIPLGVALSPKLSNKKIWIILTTFVSVVSIASIITAVKIIFPQHFNITDVRDASYVSHVSFSLQIVFSVFILWYSAVKKKPVLGEINSVIILVWCAYLIVFLGFQKSLIGFISLYFTLIFFTFYLVRDIKNHLKKLLAYTTLVIIIIIPFGYIGWITYQYFNIKDLKPEYDLTTELGNRYSFDLQNKQKENGHYVYWYICNDELKKTWNTVSSIKIDEKDASGYCIYNTLIRYMTSKDLRKDSAGVVALTHDDIKNVQSGISNHIFADKKLSIYPRIYQTIWELDTYLNTGNPNDQSLSQRIEFTKAAFFIIKNHFWGIGTGNFIIEFNYAYKQTNSKLDERFRFNVHNQYLSYIVKFGIIGFLVIIFLIGSSIKWKKQSHNILLILLIIIVGISNLGETTLETHIGLPFFIYFLSLFLWHPQDF